MLRLITIPIKKVITILKSTNPILRLLAARVCLFEELDSCFTQLLSARRSFKSVVRGRGRNGPLQPFSAIPWLHRRFFTLTAVGRQYNKKQEVNLGQSNGDRVQVLSGLKAGDKAVVKGVYQVKLAAVSSVMPEGHSH